MRIRECAILMSISLGESNSTIAEELALSNMEVRQITNVLYNKLSISKRAEAGAFHIRFRDEIIAHRKSLIQESEDHSRRAELRLVAD